MGFVQIYIPGNAHLQVEMVCFFSLGWGLALYKGAGRKNIPFLPSLPPCLRS